MVHSALEKNPFGTVSELEDNVMEHWSDLGFDVPWVDKFWRKKLDGMLVGMAEYVSYAKAQNREVLAKEQIFTVKLDIPNSENKILITGSIDRIEKTEADTILIIDFKTGTPKCKLEANIEEHRQLQSYQLAYRIGELSNRDGNIVERGLSVEGAALIYPTPKAVRNKHKVFGQTKMTDDQFEDFKKHLIAVAESMHTTNFEGKAEVDDDFGDGNKFKQKLFRTPEVSSDE